MSEHEISMAQAEIVAITEAWREACVERDALRTENASLRAENSALRALLLQHGIDTADEATEPEDGVERA